MKLYLVRLIRNKEAVGIFWSNGGDDLWWEVDQVTTPGICEWTTVKGNAAIIWEGQGADPIGVNRDGDEGFSMAGAAVDSSLGEYVDCWRPLKWTPFNGVPPIFRGAREAAS